MKRKKCAVTVMCLLLACFLPAGCAGGGNEDVSGDRKNDFYIVSNSGEDIAALFFLGTEKEFPQSKAFLQEKYFSGLDEQWPTELETVETEQWAEIYLLLPKYPDTMITVQSLDTEEQPFAELISTSRPVLLRCNFSDVAASAQVTVKHGEKEVTFKPRISLRGTGNPVIGGEGIYTEDICSAAQAANASR